MNAGAAPSVSRGRVTAMAAAGAEPYAARRRAAHWPQVVALVAGLGVVAALFRTFGLGVVAAALRGVQPRYLLVSAGFGSAARLGYALRWRQVSRTVGQSPSLWHLVAARLAGDAVGTLLPAGRIGGDPVRVALVRGGRLGGAAAGAGVVVDRIIEVTGNMLWTMAAVVLFAVAYRGGPPQRAAAALLASMSVLLLALVVALHLLRRGMRPLRALRRAAAGARSRRWARRLRPLRRAEDVLVHFFSAHAGVFMSGVAVSLGIEVVLVGECHFLLRAAGVSLDLPTLLMALVTTGVARAVPVPGGIGAMEAGQVALLGFTAGAPGTGFVVGVLLRLQELAWCAVGLLVLVGRGIRRPRLWPSLGRAVP